MLLDDQILTEPDGETVAASIIVDPDLTDGPGLARTLLVGFVVAGLAYLILGAL